MIMMIWIIKRGATAESNHLERCYHLCHSSVLIDFFKIDRKEFMYFLKRMITKEKDKNDPDRISFKEGERNAPQEEEKILG
jgi:hypothetical protein